MANCTLTAGLPLSCLESTGGIKNVYISAFSDDTVFTLDANNVIDGMSSSETFYTYKFRPQTASLNEEGSHSIENGTHFYTQTLAMIFHKMETAKRNNLLVLKGTQMHVIVETQNGDYWLLGKENGCYMTASNSATGQGYGDLSGYNITITGTEPDLAIEMNNTTFGSLTISA
jgi:hypothetical protein